MCACGECPSCRRMGMPRPRCDSADSGLPYGYNAETADEPCSIACQGSVTGQTVAEVLHGTMPPEDVPGAVNEVTAHLAAILADPETVEAVAKATERVYFETFDNDMGSIDDQYARAAIAVIGARLGLA